MKKLLLSLVLLGLFVAALSSNTLHTTATDNLLCVPSAVTGVVKVDTNIDLGFNLTLKGRFYYPDPFQWNTWKANSLPGIAMTHGFAGRYDSDSMDSQATALSRQCMVVLTFNWLGQGKNDEANTRYTFNSEPEREALVAVTNKLIAGPPNQNIVDSGRLGILGFSQAGFATWIAVADNVRTRGRYLAAAPYDGAPFLNSQLLPQNCVNNIVGGLFYPNNVRIPWPTCWPSSPHPCA
ncbi:MAG: hypothetical protein AB1791_19205 [Chloroflexota bacterium]